MADGFAELPSAAELVERIGRHQREMLDWAEGRRSYWNLLSDFGMEGRAACAVADAQEVVKLSAVIQAEVTLLNFLTPRYVVTGDDTPVVQL